MMKLRVWKLGEFIEIDENTEFYVGRCGSGHTVFGERAKLHKVLAKHLVFITESGALVKTTIDTMSTVGKAKANDYWVGLGDRTDNPNYIYQPVHYWNEKKLCMEYK